MLDARLNPRGIKRSDAPKRWLQSLLWINLWTSRKILSTDESRPFNAAGRLESKSMAFVNRSRGIPFKINRL